MMLYEGRGEDESGRNAPSRQFHGYGAELGYQPVVDSLTEDCKTETIY